MHVVMFSMNRAFHLVMKAGRELTKEFGLTPSRFNLMNALLCEGGALRQVFLRKMLGVSAPNVSRMVSSLAKDGLVVRRHDKHGRSCGVALTDKGRACIERAVAALVVGGRARAAVRSFFPPWPDGTSAKRQRTRDVKRFIWGLDSVRKALRDRAIFEYPWVRQNRQPARIDYWPDLGGFRMGRPDEERVGAPA
jgi:DNA-binding MarR family transcriptional regulator